MTPPRDGKEVVTSAPENAPKQTSGEDEPSAKKGQTVMQAARSQALRPFIIISISYLLFTITDGAIRMIVLLHAYNKNFSALQVAFMFTLYELAGVVTNLAAGLMGARWGIRFTLICGLFLQLVSYGLLFGWQDSWSRTSAIIYVTVTQMFAGVAKDLTKLGGKTVTKLVTPEEKETQLFKLVSLLTGWKNSLKGVGYFLGSALLQVSYELALCFMMGLVVLALPFAIFGLESSLGTAKNSNARWHDIFRTKNGKLNILSLARLFLFASRDFWFEVPLPFFLRSPSCDGLGIDPCSVDADCTTNAICDAVEGVCANLNTGGGCGGLAFPRTVVGAFLGGYIILYGQVQSYTPQLVTGPLRQTPPNKLTEVFWGLINCLPTLAGGIVLQWTSIMDDDSTATAILVTVIITFAIIFAINSSIHSFLVVNYASTEKVAVSVGFYYMSNAVGRLFGTLGSGLLYTYVGDEANDFSGNDAVAGLAACFFAGTCSSLLAALITTKIDDDQTGLKCGPCCTIVSARGMDGDDKDEEMEMAENDKKMDESLRELPNRETAPSTITIETDVAKQLIKALAFFGESMSSLKEEKVAKEATPAELWDGVLQVPNADVVYTKVKEQSDGTVLVKRKFHLHKPNAKGERSTRLKLLFPDATTAVHHGFVPTANNSMGLPDPSETSESERDDAIIEEVPSLLSPKKTSRKKPKLRPSTQKVIDEIEKQVATNREKTQSLKNKQAE